MLKLENNEIYNRLLKDDNLTFSELCSIIKKPRVKEITSQFLRAIFGKKYTQQQFKVELFLSLFLIYKAFWRLIEPQVITGSIIVLVATVALIIDIITALITFNKSKNNLNMKAAFLHNLSDALFSIAVIIAGILIFLYKIYWVDTVLTFLVAGLILFQAIKLLPSTIHLLMEGSPDYIVSDDIKNSIKKISGIQDTHHIHVWHLDENRIAMEAHVVVTANKLSEVEDIKDKIKLLLKNNFNIVHSTLEFEHHKDSKCEDND